MSKRYEQAKTYTEKYRSKLLPCAKCGNTDIRICTDRSIFPPKNVWFAACSTPRCDCTESYTSVRQVIRQWNSNESLRSQITEQAKENV